MIIDFHSIVLVITYVRPGFFTMQNWAWPLMYIGIGTLLFSFPAMIIGCEFDDIIITALVGMNIGVILGILSSITPFYMIIFSLVPTVLYMIRGH